MVLVLVMLLLFCCCTFCYVLLQRHSLQPCINKFYAESKTEEIKFKKKCIVIHENINYYNKQTPNVHTYICKYSAYL